MALAGVFIRTGNFLRSGERVLSGMMQRFNSLHFVHHNAGCFSQGPNPRNGNLITLNDFEVYVAITPRPYVYPEWCTWRQILLLSSQLAAGATPAPLAARSW